MFIYPAIIMDPLWPDNVNEATTYCAVALELLHNATLMHDDVIDQWG